MKDTTFTLGGILHALKGTKRQKTAALILAGGSGTRMGGAVTKQLMTLSGKSVVAHTLTAFEECPYVDEIIVAAKKDEIPLYSELKEKYGISKLKAVCEGGADRQESAYRAFGLISDDMRFVAIHDAARCLITPKQIERVIVEAFASNAAIAASPSKDTVKITQNSKIVDTPDRKLVWNASTPQVFKTELYRVCIYKAIEDGVTATDDSALAERLGFAVNVVDVGYENIKITTPIDVLVAQAILDKRKEDAKES